MLYVALHAPPIGSPEEAQALLAAIITSSDDAIVSKDLHGIVRSWNQSAERIFGYTAEEIVGKSITILFPPDRLDEEPKILERLKRGERVDHFETIRVRKDGTHIAISVTISPIHDRDGKVIGASKVARDITHNAEIESRFLAPSSLRLMMRSLAKTSMELCGAGINPRSACSATRKRR